LGDSLDDKDVPLIVRQTYACNYNYTPPAPPEPVVSVVEEPEGEIAANGTPGESISGIVSVESKSPSITDDGGLVVDEKKRKRITPVLVTSEVAAAVDVKGLSTELTNRENLVPSRLGAGNIISDAVATTHQDVEQPQKTKKRITPMTLSFPARL
jgi:hypothetical protein